MKRSAVPLLASLLACSGGSEELPIPRDAGTNVGSSDGGTPHDGGLPRDGGVYVPPSSNWCDRAAVDPPATASIPVALSEANAEVRLFGVAPQTIDVGSALSSALLEPDALEPSGIATALDIYAAGSTGVCAIGRVDRTLEPARVAYAGDTVIVRPGTGAFALPTSPGAFALDLRGLPDVPELESLLERTLASLVRGTVARPIRAVRRHYGMTDEYFAPMNAYATDVVQTSTTPIYGTAMVDVPLAVLTDDRMAPAAAELAASLRLQGRAWLFGEDVHVRVAESRARRIGDRVLLYRVEQLGGTNPWPDVVPADIPTPSLTARLDALPGLGRPSPPSTPAPTRARMLDHMLFGTSYAPSDSRGAIRAALIYAHGAARWFFPYFDVVGDEIDARLEEALAALPDTVRIDAETAYRALRRFGEALHDGHNFVFDPQNQRGVIGGLPLRIDDVGTSTAPSPVVVRSLVPQIEAGDVVTRIDGVDVADWYAEELARTSAASDGYRFDLATRQWISATGPRTLELVGAAGRTYEVTISPIPSPPRDFYAPTTRPSGPLTDLGEGDILYINLDAGITTDVSVVTDAISNDAGNSVGMILDMRGYPGVDHYAVARHLIAGNFSSPVFRVPVWIGADAVSIDEQQFTLTGSTPNYAEPIVLLVGPISVSAAENFSMLLVGAERVTIVGRPSAATNGNICALAVPGGWVFSFTCMDVLFADQSRFHGIGIQPDVVIAPTAESLRAGRDVELEAAIRVLRGG